MRLSPGIIRTGSFFLVGVCLFALTNSESITRVHWALEQSGRYEPSYRISSGGELALVYIGSSRCGPSNADELPGWIDDLKVHFAEVAASRGVGFTAVGIARDWDAAAGVSHLRKFGLFDEILVGRNWLNTGLLRYVWNDLPGPAATPQLILVERSLVVPDGENRWTGYDIRKERLVARKVGLTEIQRWHQERVGN